MRIRVCRPSSFTLSNGQRNIRHGGSLDIGVTGCWSLAIFITIVLKCHLPSIRVTATCTVICISVEKVTIILRVIVMIGAFQRWTRKNIIHRGFCKTKKKKKIG